MIEIKNIGKKIVHVGKVAILPGTSAKVTDKAASTPAIKILAKKNLLILTEVKEEEATAAETATETAAAETATETTSSKKKTTSSKKTAATDTEKTE